MNAAVSRGILSAAAVFYLTAHAAFAFEVAPAKAEFSAQAGKESVKTFFVSNTEDNEIFVKAELADTMKIMPEVVSIEGKSKFTLKRDYALSAFCKVEPQVFALLPKATKEVSLKIRLPKDAAGEYYGSVFFESRPPEDKEKTIGFSSRIGMALYIAVKGTEVFKCEISRFEVLSADPLKFKLCVRNLGNIHIRPEGYMILRPKAGASEMKFDLNTIQAPILPDTELDIGVKNSESRLTPGAYNASINLRYGQNGVLEKDISFVVSEDGKIYSEGG